MATSPEKATGRYSAALLPLAIEGFRGDQSTPCLGQGRKTVTYRLAVTQVILSGDFPVAMRGPAAKKRSRHRPRDPSATSYLMSRIRSTGGRAEVALRSHIHRLGLRFRIHSASLLGKPDLAFGPARVAVFVDSDFWHGRVLLEHGVRALRASLRTNNRNFWVTKLRKNVARDSAVTAQLVQMGWLVVRYWESDLIKDVRGPAESIAQLVRARLAPAKHVPAPRAMGKR
jgi:DNA mismatch endonuclease, patch repair protein